MKAYCQQTFGWIHFSHSEAFNLWTGNNFLASINFLKQESWTQRAETGEGENFAFGMPMEDWDKSSSVYAYKCLETKIYRLQRIHISISEIHI